jgi:hypothetical protein
VSAVLALRSPHVGLPCPSWCTGNDHVIDAGVHTGPRAGVGPVSVQLVQVDRPDGVEVQRAGVSVDVRDADDDHPGAELLDADQVWRLVRALTAAADALDATNRWPRRTRRRGH